MDTLSDLSPYKYDFASCSLGQYLAELDLADHLDVIYLLRTAAWVKGQRTNYNNMLRIFDLTQQLITALGLDAKPTNEP